MLRIFWSKLKKLSINIENKQNVYYDMLKEGKLVKGSIREINIDELIMVLLQKVNIAEICPTNLDLKFKTIAKKKKKLILFNFLKVKNNQINTC